MKRKCARAEPFIATRNHHLSELAEDYVEIISDLYDLKGEAKVCDIAEHLGVTHVTVIRTIDRLKQKGYLAAEKNKSVVLTAKGAHMAAFCKDRHRFLVDYLMALGVPKHIALVDVEGMEHHVSPATMEAFNKHLKLIQQIPSYK